MSLLHPLEQSLLPIPGGCGCLCCIPLPQSRAQGRVSHALMVRALLSQQRLEHLVTVRLRAQTPASPGHTDDGQVNSRPLQAFMPTEILDPSHSSLLFIPNTQPSRYTAHPDGDGSRVSHTAAPTCRSCKCTGKCFSSRFPGAWLWVPPSLRISEPQEKYSQDLMLVWFVSHLQAMGNLKYFCN